MTAQIESADCVVIGAGVVGLAIARAMARQGREVLILESETMFGSVTSSRNSEVIHAGIFYKHGSLKERLCIEGRDKMYSFCDAYQVTTVRTGKLVFAANEGELAGLRKLQAHAAESGVYMTYLSATEARLLEPNLTCAAALHSPLTGIVDSHGLMLALLGDAESRGAMIAYNSPVTGGRGTDDGIVITVGGEGAMTLKCRTVINAAGLSAQSVSRGIAGVKPASVPPQYFAKGNYFYLSGKPPFKQLIYPLPGSHSLGLHYTLDLGGQGRFGPDLEWVDTIDYDVSETRAESFYREIRKYWPELPDGALRTGYSGIRPKVQAPGESSRDFLIQMPDETGINGFVALYGIESPGLTSSLAIADYVAERLT
ncbi:MAG: NAD(P)/FAD-dependent oxidoreductase [Alphaproteobacteria bacterium]|nr:NAD(P)/FAD-dependent oxidoreductase [Alphaproteobacteria bacterium]